MKHINKIVLIAIASVALSSSIASATTNSRAPQPITITSPKVFEHEVGKTIELLVSINAKGFPTSVQAVNVDIYDNLLANRVVDAVQDWRFSPSTNDQGQSEAAVIMIPVHIKAMSPA